MNIKEYFESLDLEEIREYVNTQTPEDLYLEFKIANYPNNDSFDNKNFSKCLSGFSNSSGGLIIWGIEASKNNNGIDAAKDFKPINGLKKFENHLKRIEGKTIVPIIDGIEYKRIEESPDNGFLAVYIPPSDRAPHMALFADKHYYKRSGDSFYICEHFDIIDILNRKTSPQLIVELVNESISAGDYHGYKRFRYQSMVCIRNIGIVSAKYLVLYLKVASPFHIAQFGLDGNGNRGMTRTRGIGNFDKYLGGTEVVLHPDSIHEVDKISLNELGFDKVEGDLSIEFKLLAEGMKMVIGSFHKTKEALFK